MINEMDMIYFRVGAEQKVNETEVIEMIDEICMIYGTGTPIRRSIREKS